MTTTFTNRPIDPLQDQLSRPLPGVFVQDDDLIYIVNILDEAVEPGEPIPFGNTLLQSPKVIYPGKGGGCRMGNQMDYRLHPGVAAAIDQGDKVYWNYDLTSDGKTGWATNVVPTNGFFLGYAVVARDPINYAPGEVLSGVAAAVGSRTVRVVMPKGFTSVQFGTTPWDGTSLEQYLDV